MSLTNMRRVPGSSTNSIIRAASPPTSGIEANSRNLTRITPSVAGIGAGNGSVAVCAIAAAIVVSACRGTQNRAEAPGRPNVLVILLDDLRWNAPGYAGHPHVRTPQIDRIANEGVNFRNAFTTTSLCSPSRASLLSGVYAHRHGVTDNFTELPGTLETFPRVLQTAGYTTAYVGKWHMGENNDEPRPGFDYFVTHKGQGQYFDTEFNFNGERREKRPGYYTSVVTDIAVSLANSFAIADARLVPGAPASSRAHAL